MKKILFILILAVFSLACFSATNIIDNTASVYIVNGTGDTLVFNKNMIYYRIVNDEIKIKHIGTDDDITTLYYSDLGYASNYALSLHCDSILNVNNISFMDLTIDDTVTAQLYNGDTVVVRLESYDVSSGGDQQTLLNPPYSHRTFEQPIDETNLDTDTTYGYVAMETFKHLSVHQILSGGVDLTMWMANTTDCVNGDTTNWVNVTNTFLGSAVISDETDLDFIDTAISCLKIMFRIITSDASNSAAVHTLKYY